MSIERTHGKMQLVCNDCGEPLTKSNGKRPVYEQDEFDIMIDDAKTEGWKIVKDKTWEHYCSDCGGS